MTLRARRSLDRQAPVLVTVPRLWPGDTVVCLGGGPSLTADDVRAVRDRARVIAVNNAYQLAPWADVLYAADAAWWALHRGVPTFGGLKYSLEARSAVWPGVQVLQNTGNKGLEQEPTGLRTGRNSGYQAINLAVHFGAARVVLLGYDMQTRPHEPAHWFGDHPAPLMNTRPDAYQQFRQHFETIVAPLEARGVDVINCSRQTALTAFPCRPLAEVFP